MESNRRAFLAGLGGLAGGSLMFRTIRRELSAPSVLVSADSNNGPVKIVQFDDAGKKLGVAAVPKVVKSDEESCCKSCSAATNSFSIAPSMPPLTVRGGALSALIVSSSICSKF